MGTIGGRILSGGGGGGLKLSWLPNIKNNTTAPLMIIIYESIIFFIYIWDLILIYFIN